MTADDYVRHLQLLPHPEGGFYKETYRSPETITASALPARFGGDRKFSTAIYFLLPQGNVSVFHKIKSDECWHFYTGGPLLIHMLDGNSNYKCITLGNNTAAGELLQYVVPANTWFASEPAPQTAFSLTGCTVAPGFDFIDFEIADKKFLLSQYPQHAEVINRLCR